MSLDRSKTQYINYFLDHLLPPILRDSRLLMSGLMRVSLGKEWRWLLEFKEKLPYLNSADIEEYYRKSAAAHINRDTDLNNECIDRIEQDIVGSTVLDIACGRGFLTKLLSSSYEVTGADFVIDESLKTSASNCVWSKQNIESLQFPDNNFDTVICAHTLEHVINIDAALSELRRVAKERLVIVLPRQRPYKYTFDLHVHFFPYFWQIAVLLGRGHFQCHLLGGDWYIVEDQQL